MALPTSFKLRIEDLVGLPYLNNDYITVDDSALQQFLVDGCYDVIFRVGSSIPDVIGRFTKKTTILIPNDGMITDTFREIVQIYRNNIRCNQGKARYHDSYTNSESIHFAHIENPVWYILNGGLHIKPINADSEPLDIYHLPDDYDIDVDTLAIVDFPKSYYEHICLYAAVKVLDYKINETIQEDEDPEMMGMLKSQQVKLQQDYEVKFGVQSGGRK